ncbi:hypothetical protein GE09DRAFT_416271 [Coniochaeta sp. 2T2.1]|nr:hypothetical protein GE09DRAFT_416271 [Coniochaeta sp. 2T2.1]
MASSGHSQCRKKVAIVGSGSAGIAALWALNRTHHDVYLYEAADRLGGRTNTVEWNVGKYKTLVDAGFAVMNATTSPNFLNFLRKLHIRTEPTNVTLGVSRDQGSFEWARSSLSSIFCQRRNLFSPRMWRLLFDIIRFNHFAVDVLISYDIETRLAGSSRAQGEQKTGQTVGQYLESERYSHAFCADYLLPLIAAIWTTGSEESLLGIPAVTLIRILWSNHILSTTRPGTQWLTITDGSKAYIDAVMKGFPSNHRFLNTTVLAAATVDGGRVRLHLEGGRSEVYDHVILATHGDEAYSIIQGTATAEEKRIMSRFRSAEVAAVLHSDESLMPRSRKAWSSLNCLTRSSHRNERVSIEQLSLTLNMNLLQRIPKHIFGDVMVTMNPLHEPDPKTVQGRYTYRHSLCNTSTIRAQQRLSRIQNIRGISYAGAWTRDGFHEDSFSSGLYVAQEYLGAKLPFRLTDSTIDKGGKPVMGVTDLMLRLVILIVQVFFIEVIDRAVESHKAKSSRQRPFVNGMGGRVKQKKVC